MHHNTALTLCPDYPPQNLERLPHYDGSVSTPEENKAMYHNLLSQGQALLAGSMSLCRRDMRLTTNTHNGMVIASVVQPQYYPPCGFTFKLKEESITSNQSLYIELRKLQAAENEMVYVRHQIRLDSDGTARSDTVRQGMVGRKLDVEKYRNYEAIHEMTTEELRILDDLFVFIGAQHESTIEQTTGEHNRRSSLTRFLGQQATRVWRNLTGN